MNAEPDNLISGLPVADKARYTKKEGLKTKGRKIIY
jgi:hypothetical protein